jgi:phage shock protein E
MKRTLMAVMVLAVAAACSFAAGPGGKDYRDPAQLAQLIEKGQPPYLLVDVRTPQEFATGFIPTAVNIPVDEIAGRPPTKDKGALVVVYCRSGRRSAQAKSILEGMGYTGVVDFGGISRWTGTLAGTNE